LLILLFITPAACWRLKIRRDLRFLLIPPSIFFTAAIASGLNIGLRHILPIFPFLIIIAAVTAWQLASRSRAGLGIVVALLALEVISSLHTFPNYITYANQLAGGAGNAHRYMTDSSVDWDQGIAQLATYLSTRGITDCWLASRASDAELEYYGIPCRPLLAGFGYRLGRPAADFPGVVTGTILISANEAAGQAWGPDELNPYRQFYDTQSNEIVGNSILVFNGRFDVSLASAMNHAVRARQLAAEKRWTEAEQEARAGLALASDSAEMNARLCLVLRDSGKTAEAAQYCETAMAIAHKRHPEYSLRRMPSVAAVAALKD